MGVFREGHSVRWSMAAIDDSIGGVRNFERWLGPFNRLLEIFFLLDGERRSEEGKKSNLYEKY